METSTLKNMFRYSILVLLLGFAAIGIYKTFFDGTSRALQEAEQAAHYQNVKLDDIKTVKPGDTFEITTSEPASLHPKFQKLYLLQMSYDKNIFKLTSEKVKHLSGGNKSTLTFAVNKDVIEGPGDRGGIHAIILWHANPEFLYQTVDMDKDKNSGKYTAKIRRLDYEVFGFKVTA